jgi:hypothetical protein
VRSAPLLIGHIHYEHGVLIFESELLEDKVSQSRNDEEHCTFWYPRIANPEQNGVELPAMRARYIV